MTERKKLGWRASLWLDEDGYGVAVFPEVADEYDGRDVRPPDTDWHGPFPTLEEAVAMLKLLWRDRPMRYEPTQHEPADPCREALTPRQRDFLMRIATSDSRPGDTSSAHGNARRALLRKGLAHHSCGYWTLTDKGRAALAKVKEETKR